MSTREGEVVPGHSDGWGYQALVLLLTVPLAAFVSNSFPLSAVIASVSGANGFDLGPYFVLWQLAVTVLMLFVFYKLGEHVDFAGQYRRLTLLAFAGALLGNLPGFYVYQSFFFGGSGWENGFGYVSSFGIPEPSSLIDLLTAAVASFMIPLAGLALAHFRFQLLSHSDDAGTNEGPEKPSRPVSPFVVAFLVVLAFLPVTRVASSLFASAPFPTIPYRFTIQQLIPGYAGFLVYPILLLVAFYMMGSRLDMDVWGALRFRRFAFSVFAGAVVALFVVDVLSLLIDGASVSRVLEAYNLARLGADLLSSGVMVVILSFAALSLGYFAGRSHTTPTQESTKAQ